MLMNNLFARQRVKLRLSEHSLRAISSIIREISQHESKIEHGTQNIGILKDYFNNLNEIYKHIQQSCLPEEMAIIEKMQIRGRKNIYLHINRQIPSGVCQFFLKYKYSIYKVLERINETQQD